MAQEINEQMGRVLRERGLIGDTLDGFERKTKFKREQLVYGEWAAPATPHAPQIAQPRNTKLQIALRYPDARIYVAHRLMLAQSGTNDVCLHEN
ncbi:hypothetical protein MRX96_005480 [Rhipicephalus microplus]